MISVRNLDNSNEELLVNVGSDFEINKSLEELTISFSCYESDISENNYGYLNLNSNSIVNVEGYDFFITNFNKNEYSKRVSGLSTFFRHSKTRKNDVLDGIRTGKQRLDWLFENLNYSYTASQEILNRELVTVDFGNDNIVSLVKRFSELYNCEFEILPGNVINFETQIGGSTDYQYRYKYNISDVVINEDTSNLYTKITAKGEGGLELVYTSPNAAIFGELEAEPFINETISDSNELLRLARNQILDTPLLTIQSDVYDMTIRNLGETIWYIYEPLNIEMQTRIISQSLVLQKGELVCKSVVFGNSLPSSIEDLNVDRAQDQKELEENAILQTRLYNGVSINREEGVKVERSDGMVTVFLNATEGIRITNNSINKFFVDTNGNVVLDGRLRITNGNGSTPLLDAFLDTFGGRLDLYDIDGNLNVRTGSEERNGNQRGGIINLYDDGQSNLRVQMGALAAYGGNGSLAVYDADNRPKAGIFAVPGNIISGLIYVNDGNGNTVTSLSASEGRINNEIIATQPWVANYVSNYVENALANYTPPSP